MNDDSAGLGIASLNLQFQRLCSGQQNVGGRLSLAKTKFAEAMWWIRINDEKAREQKVTTERPNNADRVLFGASK